MFTYLKHGDIDHARWDATVGNDPSGLPYGLSWWLDAVCPGGWDGIIIHDYRAVMPLPKAPFSVRNPWSSWARPQVQRPFFTQQCGPFGAVYPGDISRILSAIPASLATGQLPFTENIAPEQIPPGFSTSLRNNYVLDLGPELATIQAGYHKDLRRKLRKHGPTTLLTADPEEVLSNYRQQVKAKAGLKTKHFTRARALIRAALRNNAGYCYLVKGPDDETLATGFFPSHKGRIINLLPASTPAGYRREGMALLLNEVIKKHRGPGKLLDFEGSDVPGIARFFSYFGPQQRPYPTIR